MRNYFLLEAGDTMYDFYTAIFERVREKESWQQLSFLNAQLQEAVGQRHPEDSSRYCSQEILILIITTTPPVIPSPDTRVNSSHVPPPPTQAVDLPGHQRTGP